MFVRDIGHHRHIEIDAVQTPLCQPVTGHLQHAVRQAVVAHLRQIHLDIRCAGGRHMQAGIGGGAAEIGGKRADITGSATSCQPQDAVNQGAGGGLAIGAGDADHHQIT